MRIKPGTYPGTLTDYGISETKAGDPQVFLIFDVNAGDQGNYSMTWYGLMNTVAKESGKKAPIEYTIKTILDCGFSGESPELLAAGPESNLMPLGIAMDLRVEDNTYDGTTTNRIRFVNVPGQGGGPGRVGYEEVTKKVSVDAIRAELIKQRANRPHVEKKQDVGW